MTGYFERLITARLPRRLSLFGQAGKCPRRRGPTPYPLLAGPQVLAFGMVSLVVSYSPAQTTTGIDIDAKYVGAFSYFESSSNCAVALRLLESGEFVVSRGAWVTNGRFEKVSTDGNSITVRLTVTAERGDRECGEPDESFVGTSHLISLEHASSGEYRLFHPDLPEALVSDITVQKSATERE